MVLFKNGKSGYTILIAVMLFYSCTRKDEQPRLSFLEGKLPYIKTTYHYEMYPDGKIKSVLTGDYHYKNGVLIDSSLIEQQYFFYNVNGKVDRILYLPDTTERFKRYDDLDSLIANIVMVQGDTFMLDTFVFQNGRKIKRTSRMLFKNKSPKEKNYDTLGSTTEFQYNGEYLHKEIQEHRSGDMTETYYLPTDQKGIFDIVIIGPRGDTTTHTNTVFQNDMRIVTSTSKYKNSYSQRLLYYNKDNKLVTEVLNEYSYNYKPKHKYTYTYEYDLQGNMIEMLGYEETPK